MIAVVIDNSTPLVFSTREDTSFTITQAELLANASDIDGDTETYVIGAIVIGRWRVYDVAIGIHA
jgi:hypothetical protein